jgi:hypothetical protein
MVTFMIIMYIDKIMIGHSHDHEYEVSFIAEPKKNENQEREMKIHTHKPVNEFGDNMHSDEKGIHETESLTHK